ncbi:hypothetical protein OROMI_005114 [Orobanche minor]
MDSIFKIRPSQEILKIRDGTPLESEEILLSKRIGMALFNKLNDPSNIVQKKRVARILFFKIRSFQEILKIHDGTPLESEEILTYIKKPPKRIVARILFFKIRPSQEILKIRDGTPLEAEEILTHKKSSRNGSVWHFFNKLDDPSNIVQKERVARIIFFKIRPFQEILKIHDGTPSESEEILTYIKKPPKQERVARILFFKIRSFQEILKIHDGTPLESEEILTYIKKPPKQIDGMDSIFKIRPSQEILKIRDGTPLESFQEILKIHDGTPLESSQEIQKNHDGTPLESEEISTYIKKPPKQIVAWILFFKIRSFQEILKIHDGTPLESEEILTYIKKPPKQIGMALSSKLYVPNNVVHKKRVAWILFFKIRPSQEILKIRDGTHLEAEEILTYIKKALETNRSFQEILKIHDGTPLESEEILTYIKSPQNGSVWHFSSKLYVHSNVVQKKRVARILFFKIRPSQEILKIRDGTPLEAEEILTHKKVLETDRSSQEIQKNHDDRSFQEILKIHDGTPLESEEILTYIKKPPKQIGMALSSKLYVPNNVVHKKRVAWILFFKIRPSQEILKIRDGTHLEAEEILTYIKKALETDRSFQEILKIHDDWPSQEILKIRDGTPLESEEILLSKRIGMALFNKLNDPSNIVQKKRVARILFFKIRSFQEILKIHDGTPLESEEILTYIKKPPKRIVARILFFKIRPSQEILKIRDGTPLEAEEILTHKKSSRNGSVWHFFNKLDDPSNIVQKERVARIIFFKIRPFQEILKIHDGTPSESEEILTYIKKPPKQNRSFQEILKIHDGTPLESEEILTYIKKPPKQIGMALSSKLYVPNNVVHKKRVAWILFFKIRPSQEILKIRDGTHLEAEEILTYIKKALETNRSFQEILKIHDGTPLESEEILTYIKSPQNGSVWHFSSKLYVHSNVVQKKRVARILFFKIRPSQEILKIRDGTPLEAEEILTHKKVLETDRSFQEILKIHDGTPLESEEILTYIKKPPKQIGMALSSKLYVPNNVVHKKRVAWILFFKIRPSQEILKIRDGTHLEAEEILTYIKKALETDRYGTFLTS